jgi:hypothetical protein
MPRVDNKNHSTPEEGEGKSARGCFTQASEIARMKISYNTVNANQHIVDGHRVDHVHPRPSPQVHYRDG